MKTKLLTLITAFLAFSFVHAQDITSDLLVYYPFTSDANDASSSSLHGTVNGATLVEGHDGTPNGAYSFDGVDDVITLGVLPISSGSFTVSYWLNLPTGVTANQSRTIISTRPACGEGRFFELSYINSSTYGYAVSTEIRSNAAVSNPNSEYFPGTNQWVHVAMVKDNSTQTNKFFINGVAYDETAWGIATVDVSSATAMYLGLSACNGNGRYRFNGSIDELRVYDRALTSGDVRLLLNPSLVSVNADKIIQSDFALKALFTRNIDAATANSTNVIVKDENDNTIASTVTLDGDTIFVTPDNPLPEGQNISFSLANLLSTDAETFPDTTLTFFTAFSDLVAAFTFDGNANDDFGALGSTSVSGSILAKNRLNKVEKAYSFDGSNDYMQVSDNDLLDFDTDQDLSVALWFKSDQSSTTRVFFDKGDGDSRFLGRLRDTGQVDWYLDYGTEVHSILSPVRYDDGFWHHAAFVLDRSGEQKLYVDGVLVVSATPSTIGTLTNSLPLRFGSLSNSLTQYMNGSLDDIFIYSKVLSQSEITTLANIDKPTFLELTSQTPLPNKLDIEKDANISIDFDKDVDASSTLEVIGSLSGFMNGTISAIGTSLSFDPTNDFISGEEVTIVIGSNVQAVDGDTLSASSTYQFRIKPNLSPEYPNTVIASDSLIDNFVNGEPSLAAADFDNDGDLDIVGTSGGEGKVTFYENDGSGVFGNQINLTTSATDSYDVIAGDMNNDGLMDVFVSYNNRIVWFENLGAGSFSAENLVEASVGTRYLKVADLNHDGYVDLVASQYLTEKNIAVYFNNGDETFAVRKSLYNASSTSQLFSVEIADINGDNNLDVVFSQLRGGIQYLRNLGDGSFAGAASLVNFPETGTAIFPDGVPMGLSVDDMDGDGDNDLVAGSYDPAGQSANVSKVAWAENNGSGSFSALNTIDALGTNQTNIWEINVNTEDVDGDGDMDILLFAKTGNLSWYENLGQGTFSVRKEVANIDPGQTRLNLPQAYDLTGDGALEIVAAGGGQLRYFKNVDQLSVASISPITESTNIDLDADIAITFDLDVALESITTANVLVSGSKSGSIAYTSNYDSKVLTLNPDTDFSTGEIITVSISGLLGADGEAFSDYTSTFKSFTIGTLAHYPLNGALVAVTDSVAIKFNSELTLASLSNTSLQIMSDQRGLLDGAYEVFEDSTAIFKPNNGFYYGEKITVYTSQSIEFGGNVLEDLISFDFQIGSLSPEEAVTFSTTAISSPNSSPFESSVGDFDNDGDLDVYFTDIGGSTSWIENNNGFGSFNTDEIVKSVSSITPLSSAASDLNKDGKVEAIMANYYNGGSTNGYIEHYSYDESTMSWVSTIVTDVQDPESFDIRGIAVSDLDLDGQLELITVANNNGSSRLGRWRLNTSGALTGSTAYTLNSSTMYDVQVGDIDSDGKPDVVLASESGTFWYSNEVLLDFSNFDNETDKNEVNIASVPYKLALADIDQDGDMDIIQTTSFNQNVIISLNDGAGSFTNTTIATGSQSTRQVQVGDMDGDGDLDIVYSNWQENAIDWLRNDGGMTFVKTTISSSISEPEGISLGDIDKDGDMDVIAVSSEGGGVVYLVKNLSIDNNLPPSLVNPLTSFSMEEDAATTEMISDVSVYFNDVEGDNITYEVLSSDVNVSATLNVNAVSLDVTADFFGSADVTITGTDSNGGATDMVVAVTVNAVNDAPLFTLSGDVNVDEDFTDPVIVSVTQMQPANEADQLLNYTISPATVEFATVSINAETGEITIESIADAFGSQEFTISVDDGENENNTASSTFTLTVNSINDLVGLSASNGSYQEDFTGEQVISIGATHPANESDQTITYSIAPATEEVDFASIVFDEELLTLTTNVVADGFGSQLFTISANDGMETSTIDVTVEVTSVNDAPDFELSTNALTLGQDFSGTESITLTDLSPANESESITYSLNPSTVAFATINFDTQTGTTSISSVNGGTGSQTFTVSASDGDLSIANTFTLEVLANQAPAIVAAIDDQTFEEDATVQTIDSDITDNFSDPDGDNLTFGVSTDNNNVTASLDGNQLKVELAANFFGTAIVSLTATDATLSTTDEFTVSVTSVNDAPVLEVSISDVSTNEDASFAYSLPLNTFSDVEDGTPAVTATVPDWITFNATSMMFSGTPTNDEVGTHTITVTGTDAAGLTVSDDFVVTVVNTNDAPTLIAEISDLVESEDVGSFSIDLSSNFQDVDGDQLIYSITSSHGMFTSSVNGSVINFESVANANGVEVVTVEVTDGTAVLTTSFDVELTAVNDAPSFTLDKTELALEPNFSTQSIVITPDAIPTDEQSQTVTYSLSPATVDFVTIAIDETTGEVTINAIADAEGEATITVIANDGESENATHEVSFSLKIIRVLGVGDDLLEAISIYPNPSVNWIQIDVDSNKILESIRIMSVKGKIVEVIDPSLRKINVSSFKSGIYFLELVDEKEKAVIRFIKE